MKSKTKYAVVIAVALLSIAWRASVVQGSGGSLIEGHSAPPAGTTPKGAESKGARSKAACCLWQVHKKARGERSATFGTSHACETGKTERGEVTLTLTLTGEPRCDQNPGAIPNGSVLKAKGRMLHRTDGFAFFTGEFIISAPGGQQLLEGRLETIDRLGTHHPPFGTEACDPQDHLEGWLHGGSRTTHYRLIASLVAKTSLKADGTAPMEASLDGTLIKCE